MRGNLGSVNVHQDFPSFTGRTSETGRGMIGAGCCTRCGRDRKKNDPGVVATDVRFYGEGEVVFCWPCSQEIGGLTGMATPQAVAKLEQRIAELEQAVAARDADLEAVSHLRVALDLVADAAKASA